MRKLQRHPGRGALAAALLVSLLAAGGAAAQSGRRKSPPPQPPAQSEPQGESESGQKPAESKPRPKAAVNFVVMEHDDMAFGHGVGRGDVMESFVSRLNSSASVSVSRAGRGSRGEAHKRAKGETDAYVVLFALEEQLEPDPRGTGRIDQRSLVIRTYVYSPKTGSLKYSDTIWQRSGRPTVGVGGVRVPVPRGSTGRYPSQYELRQSARDAADRILSRFHLPQPADIP
jgi:hypothetical protein